MIILRLSRSTRAGYVESSSAPSSTAAFTIRTSDTAATVTPAPTLQLHFATGETAGRHPPVELRRPPGRAPLLGHASARFDRPVATLEPARPPESPASAPAPEPIPAPEPMSSLPDYSQRVELIIDSLPHQTLIEPIPVIIDPLGNDVFIATVRDIGISATGSGVGEALLVLKEQIEFFYEDLRARSKLDDEQRQVLQMLQTYVSQPQKPGAWVYGSSSPVGAG